MGEAVVGRSASVGKHINVVKRTHNVVSLGRLGSVNVKDSGNVGTLGKELFHFLLIDYSATRGVYKYRILGKKLEMLLTDKVAGLLVERRVKRNDRAGREYLLDSINSRCVNALKKFLVHRELREDLEFTSEYLEHSPKVLGDHTVTDNTDLAIKKTSCLRYVGMTPVSLLKPVHLGGYPTKCGHHICNSTLGNALCKKLIAEGKEPTVILGFNTKDEVFCADDFKALGARVFVTTADGSLGVKGFVTDAMDEAGNYTYFYTCGPTPMLKAVFAATATSGQFSFEERMGCGFGACMGCSCKTNFGNKRICKDGPVFEKEEILW